jgi:alkyldihydroxyacetonephosphate synthase
MSSTPSSTSNSSSNSTGNKEADLKYQPIPKRRQELLKWNGWGYRDSKLLFSNEQVCEMTGNRYKISGHKLPMLKDWFMNNLGAAVERTSFAQPEMTADKIPNAILNDAFMNEFKNRYNHIELSDDPQDRLFRAHGHTMDELFMLRYGQFERIPDLVVWPGMCKIIIKKQFVFRF